MEESFVAYLIQPFQYMDSHRIDKIEWWSVLQLFENKISEWSLICLRLGGHRTQVSLWQEQYSSQSMLPLNCLTMSSEGLAGSQGFPVSLFSSLAMSPWFLLPWFLPRQGCNFTVNRNWRWCYLGIEWDHFSICSLFPPEDKGWLGGDKRGRAARKLEFCHLWLLTWAGSLSEGWTTAGQGRLN